MIKHWTVFEGKQGGKRAEEPRVTVAPNRTIGMNEHAYNALGAPSTVELMFDAGRKMIGMRACDPRQRNAFEVRRRLRGKHYSVAAGSFLNHFGIETSRTMLFESVEMEPEGVMTLDLSRTTAVTRGSK